MGKNVIYNDIRYEIYGVKSITHLPVLGTFWSPDRIINLA
jgi:hypothetical protein